MGLARALNAGDSVILKTGATATVRRSYPAGYTGEVEIDLDGSEETERVDGLTLPMWEVDHDAAAEEPNTATGEPNPEVRGKAARMED